MRPELKVVSAFTGRAMSRAVDAALAAGVDPAQVAASVATWLSDRTPDADDVDAITFDPADGSWRLVCEDDYNILVVDPQYPPAWLGRAETSIVDAVLTRLAEAGWDARAGESLDCPPGRRRRWQAGHVWIYAELLGADVGVHRTLVVDWDTDLYDLHLILNAAMGWDDSHLHQFVDVHGCTYETQYDGDGNEDPGRNESAFTVGEVLSPVGSKLVWLYDFGDSWRVLLTRIAAPPGVTVDLKAVVVSGGGRTPPEDFGGTDVWNETVAWLRGVAECPERMDDPDSRRWLRNYARISKATDFFAYDAAAANARVRRRHEMPDYSDDPDFY